MSKKKSKLTKKVGKELDRVTRRMNKVAALIEKRKQGG